MKSKAPIKNICFTIRATDYVTHKKKRVDIVAINAVQLQSFLDMYCTEYVFQKESTIVESTGKTNPHYQGRLRLRTKKRIDTLLNHFMEYFAENILDNQVNCVAITSLVTFSPEFHKSASEFYCLKSDDSTIVGTQVRFPIPEPAYDGSDLIFSDLLPPKKFAWTRQVRYLCDCIFNQSEPNDLDMLRSGWRRSIIVIQDEEGGHGKSTFAKSLLYEDRKHTVYLPVVDTAGQIMGALAKNEFTMKRIFLDVPRDLPTTDVRKVFQIAEQIKLGIFVTSYYASLQTRLQVPPAVVILTNRAFFKQEIDKWAPLNRFEFYNISKTDGLLTPRMDFPYKEKKKEIKLAPHQEYLDGIY